MKSSRRNLDSRRILGTATLVVLCSACTILAGTDSGDSPSATDGGGEAGQMLPGSGGRLGTGGASEETGGADQGGAPSSGGAEQGGEAGVGGGEPGRAGGDAGGADAGGAGDETGQAGTAGLAGAGGG
jgi:hypothetical protein